MNQRKLGATLSYVSFIISNVVGILYTPYMLRLMGQSEYGIHGAASSLISYLSLLSFGIGGAYLRYNAQYRARNDIEGEQQLNGAFFLVYSVLAVLVMICGGVMVYFARNLVENTFTDTEIARLQILMVFCIINTMLVFIFNVFMMAIQSREQYLFLRVISLVTSILTPITNVIALTMGGRAIALGAISLIISTIVFIIYGIYAVKVLHFKMTFKGIKLSLFKELFIFSSFLFLNSITDLINNSTDNVILSAVSGTAAVAIYTIGAQFRSYFMSFSTSISSVFSPKVNAIVAEGNDMTPLSELFTRIGRVQFYVLSLVMIGFVSIGKDFILLWAGPDYSDSFWIAVCLLASVYIPLFQNVGLEIQKAKNKHKARSVVYLLISLCNFALTIPLSIRFGGIGAAFATLVCMLLGNGLFMNYYYWKHIGLDIPGFWKSILRILPSFLPACAAGYICHHFFLLDSYWAILAAACSIIAVYLVSIWLFSMNQYEKGLLAAPIRKIFGKFCSKEKN